jgi:hypothetical protein
MIIIADNNRRWIIIFPIVVYIQAAWVFVAYAQRCPSLTNIDFTMTINILYPNSVIHISIPIFNVSKHIIIHIGV